jgi:hypothetical protein
MDLVRRSLDHIKDDFGVRYRGRVDLRGGRGVFCRMPSENTKEKGRRKRLSWLISCFFEDLFVVFQFYPKIISLLNESMSLFGLMIVQYLCESHQYCIRDNKLIPKNRTRENWELLRDLYKKWRVFLKGTTFCTKNSFRLLIADGWGRPSAASKRVESAW